MLKALANWWLSPRRPTSLMANDFSLEARQYLVATMRADAALVALLGGAGSIYGPLVPAKPSWPFVRVGMPISTPDRATCLDGTIEQFAIHSFAKGGSEDQCLAIRKRIIELMDGITDKLGGVNPICITYNGAQLMRDTAEAEAWHGIANFRVDVGG